MTLWLPFIVTTHAPVPEQSPDQPAKRLPAAGVGVRATVVPTWKPAEHAVPQSMPGGLLVTVPAPEPSAETVSTGSCVKVAVTV